MNSIGVIILYFGKWPDFFPFFLSSIIRNKDIHWLLFSDNDDVFSKYSNISFYKIDKTEFNRLASKKTNLNINIIDPYKLCDFKPLYGKIFEDYLSGYKFWGYSDIDVIYGQISNFITAETLQNYDVISTYQGFLSGPFCIFRNNDHIKELFKHSVSYPAVYMSQKHYGFDENIQRLEIVNLSLHKIMKAIQFSLQYFLTGKFRKSSWKEFRYQFQWYYKKSTIKTDNLADMTEVVWYSSRQSKIKTFFSELMLSERYYRRINKKNWGLIWENGILMENRNLKEVMAFHFIDQKNNKLWELPNTNGPKHRLLITSKRIRCE